ncbi:MAG: calcium channel protein [Thelocarpon superellum]|nr:MAG: calcium channel protein [Thelocarpon superellum]
MASNNRPAQEPSTPQSIQLRELPPPPDSRDITDRGARGGGRQRDLLGGRNASNGPTPPGFDDSPLRPRRQPPRLHPDVNTSVRAEGAYTHAEDSNAGSPIEDLSAFQSALGFTGLSFQGGAPSPPPPTPPSSSTKPPRPTLAVDQSEQHPALRSYARPGRRTSEDSQYYYPPGDADGDTTPLTDPRALQPISGAAQNPALGSTADFHNVRISTSASRGARLGDDLPSAEAGNAGRRGRSETSATRSGRSLSPSASLSPLSAASSMVRKMSQRVVNLSNEPDPVEQSIRRKPSQARMTEPPSFPAMLDYAHDNGRADPPTPIEKSPTVTPDSKGPGGAAAPFVAPVPWPVQENPLRGKTLGIFPAENLIRRRLCDLLVHPVTEPFILVLIVIQTILLAIQSAPNVFESPRPNHWPSSWIDIALFGLFIIYTVELVARIIVSGFVLNPEEHSSLDRRQGLRLAIVKKTQDFLSPQRQLSRNKAMPAVSDPAQPSILRSFTGRPSLADQPGNTRQQQRMRLARRAFLRHSFNRLDFLAVVSFWISFILAILGLESTHQIYVFRMLSCLRILRLLGLTSGTSVILRSLKKAAPLLANVAFLIGFFWLLFAIVGLQNFKSSFRRTCVFVDPDPNGVLPTYTQQYQFCGGQLNNVTGEAESWFHGLGGPQEPGSAKGYICPRNSLCVEQESQYNGTVSFDNILQSLEVVFVIMSSNTYTDLMYYTTQSDYLSAALFFAAGMVILSLWLINLLVAVIVSSFQVIREESKASAFTATGDEILMEADEEPAPPRRIGSLKRRYDQTAWIWDLVIVYGLVVQAFRSAGMSHQRRSFIDNSETVVTLILLVEIVLRFAADWRHFHRSRRNWVDLGLAIITTVMQIPFIHNSGQPYAWLTIFQILRIYRIVLAVPVIRNLIMTVLGNVSGILNLIIFVFLLTFLVAIFAVQLFRGQIPVLDINGNYIRINFYNIYNAFLGMYQILSSENWTLILYNVTSFGKPYGSSWIGAAFNILWFILANFIVLNMFIAVIQENFDVSEDAKRIYQVRAFVQRKDLATSMHSNLSLSSIFHLGRGRRQKDPLDYGPASIEMLLKDAVVQEFLDEQAEPLNPKPGQETNRASTIPLGPKPGTWSGVFNRLTSFYRRREANPFYSSLQFSHEQEELDPRAMAQAVVSATEQRKRAQREYLVKHPTYNDSLYLFKPNNPIRRFCQRIVGPGRGGARIQGVEPIKIVWFSFSAFVYAAIIAMVLLACVTTPLYQRQYFQEHRFSVRNWFVFSDMGFAILFTVEAVIKVVADGFFFTPNAYFRGAWGAIDGLVLVTLWVNVGTSLYQEGAVSRAVGAFKALRALRLLNFSDSARDTFQSVIVLGVLKIVSAVFVSLSLLVPFAIYGLNLFNGQFQQCNDNAPFQNSITNLTADCVGEYYNQPANDGWAVLQPRSNTNINYFSFDDFRSSLFILFQIVSQEGWTDVSWQAQMMTGLGLQPQLNASPGNAIFFIIFNLLGAVFVLTLFISVFMRNYTEQTGVAFLTADQRSWLELRKLLWQISPSKRPSNKPHQKWRNWCYRHAVKKHGKWQRLVTMVLVLHLILLVLEFYPEEAWWEVVRTYVFLVFNIFYLANIVIRVVGLSWARFRKSSWDLYSVFAVVGALISTVLLLSDFNSHLYTQMHKLFLVSIALLLIPRNNQLDQLFKTAAASLAALGNLLATWFVLFLTFAIALTQTFGLTRFGPNETVNLNFRDVPKALILLFRMSSGEGWNQIMEDYAHISEPYCVSDGNFFDSDCGSAAWARVLFISWNILSMYIFVSLFVSLIFESFSYVYQRSNGLSVVSREETRRFKQAWATFDPEGTGFIPKEVFPRLLGELSGIFEMRIYDGDYTVGSILEDCRQDAGMGRAVPPHSRTMVDGVDLNKLRARIAQIPVAEVRRRRRKLNVFYEEVMVSADPDRGISFTSVLMILAHYNVIKDTKSLKLEEFLRRRARLQRVEEAVRRNIVIGFFDTMFWSRWRHRMIDHRDSARMQSIPSFGVPEIYVDDDDNPLAARRGEPADLMASHSPWVHQASSSIDMRSPSHRTLRHRTESRPPSPGHSALDGERSLGLSPHRPGYADGFDWAPASLSPASSPGEGGEGAHTRQNSSVSAQDVMEVLDNSAWGESLRRSFTLRRPDR